MDAKGQALGLRPGMAVAQVKATYPGLRIEEADPVGDAAGLNRLAAWCLRHISPLAAANPPDGLWIDVTGCAHLFNGEAALLNLLTQRLGEAGLTARAAIADTPGAAHALARHSKQTCVLSAPGHMRQDLASLPVSALRLPEETVLGLCRLGFESIGQLMATPRAPLAKRFGGDVLQKLDQALGQAPEPIKPMLEPEIPRTRAGFPEPICTPDHLARITTLLCERLCEKLLQRGLSALRLDLVFTRVDGIPQMVRIGTAAATRDAAHLARLLKEKIETIDPGFGIESALLAAPLTAALGAHQNVSELCTEQAVADFSTLIDTLANRLGGAKIFRLAPVESDVPERSVRRVPPLVRAEGVQWPKNLPRPPRLFTPPHPVTVLALLPDHAPKHFVWRRRPYRVRHADGPERIFGEWWRTDTEFSTVRDYFGVEDESGQRFWLFRHGDGVAPETGDLRWFLHGLL
jgi:protein ImuB